MRKTVFCLIAFLLLSMPTLAMENDAYHNHDPELVGQWAATSHNGDIASLSFEDSGKFILDERSSTTLERQYRCGTWERNGDAVELAVKAQKSRFADGNIEEALDEYDDRFTVLRATANTLILRIDSKVFSFHRTA
ncbi:MAG: hypothetical protein AAF465_06680 [Pseudomonadota bacterium]